LGVFDIFIDDCIEINIGDFVGAELRKSKLNFSEVIDFKQ